MSILQDGTRRNNHTTDDSGPDSRPRKCRSFTDLWGNLSPLEIWLGSPYGELAVAAVTAGIMARTVGATEYVAS